MTDEYEVNRLDELERQVLGEARAELALPQHSTEALLERVLENAMLPPTSPAPSSPPGPQTLSPPVLEAPVSAVVKAGATLHSLIPTALLGVVVGFVGGYWTAGQGQPSFPLSRKTHELAEVELTPSPELEARPRLLPAPREANQPAVPEDVTNTKGRKASPKGYEPEPARVSFYEELSFLRRAQGALKSGRPALALGLMHTLSETNAGGALLTEREVTEALALCALGETNRAASVAKRVMKRTPSAVYVKRLEASCALKKTTRASDGTHEEPTPMSEPLEEERQ